MVVGQGRILHVDLAHDPGLDLRDAVDGNFVEGARDPCIVLLHRPQVIPASLRELLRQILDPGAHQRIRLPGLHLIGPDLVGQDHEQVPIGHAGKHLAQKRERDPEPRGIIQPLQVQGNHRHLSHARIPQCLAQQRHIIGSPAAAAGLRQDQGCMVRIVFPGFQGRNHLADGEQSRITSVIVHILLPRAADLRSLVGEQRRPVSRLTEHVFQEMEVNVHHIRKQDGVGLPHLFGEDRMRDTFRHASPPGRSL